jgi:hypothetical protein
MIPIQPFLKFLKQHIGLWLIIGTSMALTSPKIFAQQCGFEGKNAFVLTPHLSYNGDLIKGLKIYLVNENNDPYVTKSKVFNTKKKRFENRFDTLCFWENNKAKDLKKQSGYYPKFHLKGAGNAYIISVPELEDYKERGTFMPVYQALIKDVDGKLNDGDFGVRIVRLNYAHSVNICQSGIMHNEPNNPPNPGHIKRMDGGYFMPITVNLSFRNSLIADTGLVKHMYRTKKDTLFNRNGEDSLYAIKEIEIKNYRTLVTVQNIKLLQKLWAGNILIDKIVEYDDFFGDNPRDVKDFRILVSNTKGIDDQFHKRYLNYIYDEITNLYRSDTALDNYADVEINKSTGDITRSVYLSDSNGLTKITYRYKNYKWELVSIDRPKKIKPDQRSIPVIDKPSFSCISWIDEPIKAKVIYASENYYQTLRDTFRFINTCDKSIHLIDLMVGKNPDFSYTPSVAPSDTGYIYYQKILTINPNRIIFHENAIRPDPQSLLKINYSVIGKNAIVEKTNDHSLSYSVKMMNDSIFKEVITMNQKGQPLHFGIMSIGDTVRYGQWKFWNETGIETYKTYSRKVIYMVKDFEEQPIESLNFKVKKNGEWMALKSWRILGNHHVYISEGMDSLKIFTKTASNAFKLNFKNLANENYQHVYLINKNQYALSMNGFQMPVELIPNIYRVQPDWVAMQNLNGGKYGQEFFIEYFKTKYPHLLSSVLWLFNSEVIIDLNKFTEAMKNNMLKNLEKDKMILCISQLVKLPGSRITFCDRSGTLIMNYNLSYDSVKTVFKTFNFTYNGPITGTGNYYQFTYNNKIIDQHFFDIYNKACEHADVISGSLNFYFKTEIDNQIRPDSER